jgi:hypothetical protein
MSDTTDIAALKARVSIFEVASRYVTWDWRRSSPTKGDFFACCPFHSEKTASFHVLVREGYYKCFGCGAGGDVLDFISRVENVSFGEAIGRAKEDAGEVSHRAIKPAIPDHRSAAHPATDDEDRTKLAQWLWSLGRPVSGTIVETYLRNGRYYGGVIPGSIRFLPARGEHRDPAMIAAFAFADEPEPGLVRIRTEHVRAVHLTKLKPDGSGKIEGDKAKIIVGRKAQGVPITLSHPNDLLGLAITEGIEDGLSVYEATGLGVWCAGSASRMPALGATVPAYIDAVTVIAHNDEAGRKGAKELADALRARRICAGISFLSQPSGESAP